MQVTGLAEKYKSATYIEFFFDLVFVYGLTRISSLLYDDPTQWYKPLVLVLMVWWGWSQYAWATNALALDDKADKLLMLVGTGVTFFAALTIPQTFTSQITWFGALYTISRVIASLMHIIASKHDSVQKKTLTKIYLFLIPSTIFILIGSFASPSYRIYIWSFALLLDLVASITTKKYAWEVDPVHIGERYGLVIIIALGEALVTIGIQVETILGKTQVIVDTLLCFIILASIWWVYFETIQPSLEKKVAQIKNHAERSTAVRNLYVYQHLPYIVSVVILAMTFRNIILFPNSELTNLNFYLIFTAIVVLMMNTTSLFFSATGKVPYFYFSAAVLSCTILNFILNSSGTFLIYYLTIISVLSTIALEFDRRAHVVN